MKSVFGREGAGGLAVKGVVIPRRCQGTPGFLYRVSQKSDLVLREITREKFASEIQHQIFFEAGACSHLTE